MKLIDRVREIRDKEKARLQAAYRVIPPEYHRFVVLLQRNVKLSESTALPSDDLKAQGVWASEKARGTFITVQEPYFSVEGRIAWAVDVHAQANASFAIDSEIEEIAGTYFVKVTFDGLTRAGAPCRVVARAKIAQNGTGAKATNPVEVAETSALGRALGFAGYGLLGSGVASAEEVENARAEEKSGVLVWLAKKLAELAQSEGLDEATVRAAAEKVFAEKGLDPASEADVRTIVKSWSSFARAIKEKVGKDVEEF